MAFFSLFPPTAAKQAPGPPVPVPVPPPPSALQDLRTEAETVFHALDTNNDGSLSTEELTFRLKQFGLAEDSIYALFLSLDDNADGGVTIKEFVPAYKAYRHILHQVCPNARDQKPRALNCPINCARSSNHCTSPVSWSPCSDALTLCMSSTRCCPSPVTWSPYSNAPIAPT